MINEAIVFKFLFLFQLPELVIFYFTFYRYKSTGREYVNRDQIAYIIFNRGHQAISRYSLFPLLL